MTDKSKLGTLSPRSNSSTSKVQNLKPPIAVINYKSVQIHEPHTPWKHNMNIMLVQGFQAPVWTPKQLIKFLLYFERYPRYPRHLTGMLAVIFE